MQIMYAIVHGDLRQLELPDAGDMVSPGIQWGRFDELLTPAFWRAQAWQHELLGTYRRTRLGNNLTEETAACLLGGYGMPAELGLLAFSRLRDRGLLVPTSSPDSLERALSEPFSWMEGYRAYRFPRQKARYLSACLRQLSSFVEPNDDQEFRDALATLPGIGMKTASWIVRNHRGSNSVAIIDVHILRAGRRIGLFDSALSPQRDYSILEKGFLGFAAAIGAAAGLLDSLIWDHMRRLPVVVSGTGNGQLSLVFD